MNANNTLGESDNLLLMSDSYKLSHWKQYPPGTQKIYSYFESRGGRYPRTIFFGLQYILKKYLEGWQVSREKIEEAEEITAAHLGSKDLFNRAGWEYILNAYGGRLPVSIKAVPEGSLIPVSNVLMTVENTDDKCFWLTNYLETLLSQVWYPCTVATQSYYMKENLLNALHKSGTPEDIDFKLHDFGYRGVSSNETAGIGGASHLVNFKGTDTLAGIMMLRKYYQAEMAGFSIPASEHSTITSWGKEHEVDACRNMLEQYPSGLVACVSDSFDIYSCCDKIWGKELRDKVLNRDGCLVVRPDSGAPLDVLPKVMDILGQRFGYTINDKGYKVLNTKVRVIQGDGIDADTLSQILTMLIACKWSTDNIAFGSGGGLLQKLDRDTQKFAFKCSAAQVNGEWRDVYKDPVTDSGKKSKRGRLKLVKGVDMHNNHIYDTFSNSSSNHVEQSLYNKESDLLVEVFRNGEVITEYTLDEIRERASG